MQIFKQFEGEEMFYHFSDPRATKEDNFFNQMHQTKNDVDDDSEMSTLIVLLHRS